MSKELGNTENPIENVQSHDWNKERLEQLKTLMPDLFTNDGQLNINELKKVVDPNSVTETERYEFRWFGKSNAKREAFTPTDATLVYDEHRSVNPTESENLIIEGENLAVLKLLSNSYRGQVKCIYIDPPYNTGKDFVYSDKFNQDKREYWEDAEITENGVKIDTNTETDGRFHSNWLNMMYSRLLIARQLLKEDGVIFISIDDNEVHHLRKLCDEVFGEENFVANFLWKKKGTTSNVEGAQVSSLTDSTLCYAKSENAQIKPRIKLKESRKYPNSDAEGNYRTTVIEKKDSGAYKRDSMKYEINGHKPRLGKRWQIGYETAKKLEEKNRFIWDGEKILLKIYDFEDKDTLSARPNLLFEHGSTDSAANEIKIIFDGIEELFDNPKPKELISEIIKFSTNEDDIILDFFAGSGTTGQAVAELSQEDGGNRKYILVQLPEATDKTSEAYKAGYKKISDITIERNKRVVERIIKEKKEAQPDLFSKKENEKNQLKGLGFKVFKLQKSNFPRVEYAPDPEKTHEENIEALKKYIRDKEAQLISAFNKEELITEILLKNGFKLNYTLTKQEQFTKNEILFATDGDKETLVCLDGNLAEETVEYFKKNAEQKLIVLERALDTTKKWNLKHYMKDNFKAF
ncbi:MULTISPECIES: site-specific DNA-methyltransferase [unclassified Myroides]|uniref:site-specific DNA-methyltransferase n=1 Tax=unclassified Myroides TaxID=2642485 RepID=UPI003D2F7ACA